MRDGFFSAWNNESSPVSFSYCICAIAFLELCDCLHSDKRARVWKRLYSIRSKCSSENTAEKRSLYSESV